MGFSRQDAGVGCHFLLFPTEIKLKSLTSPALAGRFSTISATYHAYQGFPGGSVVKESACNAGDLGSIPGLGGSLGEGNGNLLQYSCLENSMEEKPGRLYIVHGVAKSWT